MNTGNMREQGRNFRENRVVVMQEMFILYL
jgi:hypothetical protein